jgi:hypothetical protein
MGKRTMTKKTISIVVIAVIAASVVAVNSAIAFNVSSEPLERRIVIDGELPVLSVDELSKKSKYVIIGTVTGTPKQSISIDEEHSVTRIFSDVTIAVEEDLKQSYTQNTITVRTIGGQMTIERPDGKTETVTVVSDTYPVFAPGERVMVFVNDKEPHTIWGDNYYVAGAKLGKYELRDGKAYGSEHPDGTDEMQFKEQIKQSIAQSTSN